METSIYYLGFNAFLKKVYFLRLNRRAFLPIRLSQNEANESAAFDERFECFIILQSNSQSLTRIPRTNYEKQVFRASSISCYLVDSMISIHSNVSVVEL